MTTMARELRFPEASSCELRIYSVTLFSRFPDIIT